MRECQTSVQNQPVERQTLAFVNRYRPCEFQRYLREASHLFLFYFLGLLVDAVLKILPCHRRHLYNFVATLYLKPVILIVTHYSSNFSVEISLLRRRVVFHEHHLGTDFQFKLEFGRIRCLREVAKHFCRKLQRFGFQRVNFALVYLIHLTVMRHQGDVTGILVGLEIRMIVAVQDVQALCVEAVVAYLI